MRRVLSDRPAVAISCLLVVQTRDMKIRQENWFRNEAVPHARRVSWSPHTTAKKVGIFAKLSRSNFYDRMPTPFSQTPYSEHEVECHRKYERPDVYIYKYNVSPTHVSSRPQTY